MKKKQSAVVDSYIVRIYRRDLDNPVGMVGLVETVGSDQVKTGKTDKQGEALNETAQRIGKADQKRLDNCFACCSAYDC